MKAPLIPPKDETRPICKRCLRCGFDCDGPRDTAFVTGTIVETRGERQTIVLPTVKIKDAESPDRHFPLAALLKSNETEICVCYARRHLRVGGPVNLALQEVQLGDLSTAPSSANNQIAQHAALSFATLLFGSQNGQAHLVNQGYALHGVALKQLNQALSDSKCYLRDEVIVSVVTLSLLECFVPSGPKYYLNHMMGLQRLLELRKPGSYCSSMSPDLYQAVRHLILFASLRTGKPCIFARPEWKAALRANSSDEEMQEQDLYDFLADCTILVAERDGILANWKVDLEGSTRRRDKLQRKALTLLDQLRDWRRRWESDGRNAYLEAPALAETLGAGSSPFPTVFEFSDASAALMLILYNATLIYVLRVLASLLLDHAKLDIDSRRIQRLEMHTKDEYIAGERLAALEMCRCTPYYLAQTFLSDSPTHPVFHWAMTTTWKSLHGNESPEGRWISDLRTPGGQKLIARGVWLY